MKTKRVSNMGCVDDELFLQPWFVSKPLSLKLRKMLPASQLLKMRYYFEDYGCLRCGRREGLYASNGMCKDCSVVIRARVVMSLARRFRKTGAKVDQSAIEKYLGRLKRT
jgi:hypothetical protein